MTTPEQQASETANTGQTPGVVMDFSLPAEEFALGQTLTQLHGIQFEIEQVVAHEATGVLPCLRAFGTNHEEIEAALAADSTTTAVERSSGFPDEALYRVQWTERVSQLVERIVKEGRTILRAVGEDGSWTLRILFPDRENLSQAYDSYVDAGLSVTVESIYEIEANTPERNGITDKQQVALSTAVEAGYYDVPRKVTQNELADVLEISHQALSERLQRAHSTAVKALLNTG